LTVVNLPLFRDTTPAIFYPKEGNSGFSETKVLAYRITRFHVPESNNLYSLTRRGVRRASWH